MSFPPSRPARLDRPAATFSFGKYRRLKSENPAGDAATPENVRAFLDPFQIAGPSPASASRRGANRTNGKSRDSTDDPAHFLLDRNAEM